MTTPTNPHDELVAALDPLVRAQTLSPQQANEVYRAVSTSGASSASADRGRRPDLTRSRVGTGIGTVGVGLVVAAFSTGYVLGLDSLGWTIFVAMLGPILVLALVVVASELAPHRAPGIPDELRTLAAIAGSLAVSCVALAILTIGGSSSLYYVSGLVMLVGGLAGYWSWRRQVFVVPAVIGGLVVTSRLGSHLLSSSSDRGDSSVLFLGIVAAAYGALVAVAGWRYPCRHLTGVLGGLIALSSLALVIIVNGFTGAFALDPTGRVQVSYRSDTVVALVVGLVVCLGLAGAYAATREAGFLVVAGSGGFSLPATAIPFLTQKHPLQLAALFALIGALVIGLGFVMAWRPGPGLSAR